MSSAKWPPFFLGLHVLNGPGECPFYLNMYSIFLQRIALEDELHGILGEVISDNGNLKILMFCPIIYHIPIRYIGGLVQVVSARKTLLHCLRTGVTSFLH